MLLFDVFPFAILTFYVFLFDVFHQTRIIVMAVISGPKKPFDSGPAPTRFIFYDYFNVIISFFLNRNKRMAYLYCEVAI